MNCTKFVAPLPIFINFYYYYSYFTLFLSLLITPILFYIILTKSKNLKSFKWLILNHSFWCFFFEVLFVTLKPLFFPPSLSGYSLGLMRNGSIKISAFALFFVIILWINLTTSLSITLMNRYLAAIPSNKTSQNLLKAGICFGFIGFSVLLIGDAASFYPIFTKDKNEIIKDAINYDPCLDMYFSAEPSYLFIPYENMKVFLYILFTLFICCIILAILLLFYFIYLIRSQTSQTIAKLQLSLTISAIVQLSITIIFLYIPTLILVGILGFQIQNCENLLCFVFCFFTSHSVLETFATLYFVTPYRNGLREILNNIVTHFPKHQSNIISIVETIS